MVNKDKMTSKAFVQELYLGLIKQVSSDISNFTRSEVASREALIACMWVAFNVFMAYENVRRYLLLFYALDQHAGEKPENDEEMRALLDLAQGELSKRFSEYDEKAPGGFGLGSFLWPTMLGNMRGGESLELDAEATFSVSTQLMKMMKELVELRDNTEITD